MTDLLGYTILGTIIVVAFLIIRVVLDMRQRMIVTVARPTTVDGESCQVTGNLRASAPGMEVAAFIEKASQAIQCRVANRNEEVLATNAKVAHKVWLKVKDKLDQGFKLSKEENKWWQAHGRDFDANGPLLDVKADKIQRAAHPGGDPLSVEG